MRQRTIGNSLADRPSAPAYRSLHRDRAGCSGGLDTAIGRAEDLDRQLSQARKAPRTPAAISSLPDGAFVALADDDFRVVWDGSVHRWTPAGYVEPIAISKLAVGEALVITPAPSVAALRNGYPLVMHPSVASAG